MPTKAISLIFICRHVQYLNYSTTTSGMTKNHKLEQCVCGGVCGVGVEEEEEGGTKTKRNKTASVK